MSGDDRRAKLEKLRADGIEPFPHEFPRVVPIAGIHEAHDDLAEGEETDFAYRVAGRIHARRGHGKAAFIDLDDRSGRIQLHARADVLGDESHERLLELDLGDLVGIDGTAFKTRRGELSLRVDSWQLLAKSLRAPPEKFHIVGSAEANVAERKLSNESPIGKALLGKKRNEIVSVPVPRGPARKLKITKIEAG